MTNLSKKDKVLGLLVTIFLLIIAGYFSSSAYAASNEDVLLKRANELYKEGDIEEAITNYEKIIELNPTNYEVLCFLCVGYDKTKQSTKALETCSRAINIIPDRPEAYLNLGMVYRNLGQRESEISNFEKAIKHSKSPEIYTKAYANLGFTFVSLGQYNNAQMNFKKAIEYDPKNYEAHYWLGFCYYKSGDLETARKYYEKSLEINPDYGAPYIGLGLIYQQLGDFRKAKENYQIEANLLRKEGKELEAKELESLIDKEFP